MPRTFLLRCAVIAIGLALVPATASVSSAADPDAPVTVSGTVTTADGGDPVAGACVEIRPPEQNYWDAGACTGADGTYQFAVAPGKYQVQFDDPTDELGTQWWPKVDSPVDAEWLVVRRGTPVTGIDAELHEAATLAGRAIEGATGEPMVDACIKISSAGVDDTVAYLNDVPQHWSIGGLPPGELTVEVHRCGVPWRFSWAYDALTVEDATSFQLSPGETKEIGRVELLAGVTVKGRATARRSGEPLEVEIGLDYVGGGRSGEGPLFGAETRKNGRYVVRDAQPGPHRVLAYDGGFEPEWAPQWSDGATSWGRAKVIDMPPGSTSKVDFRLLPAATIKGTLVGATEYLMVDAFSSDFPEFGSRAYVGVTYDVDGETGKFKIMGLPAADTYLCFDACWYDPPGFWFDGVRDVEDATLVELRPGKTTNVTAHMPDDLAP